METVCQKNTCQGPQENNAFYENHSCSYCDSVQDAPITKLWGPFFDDFVDMSIFMILGSVDDDKHLDIPLPHAIAPRKKIRRKAGILT